MLIPLRTTISLLLIVVVVDIKTDTPSFEFLNNTTSLKVSTLVSKDVISFPLILSTLTLSPPPCVSVLSKDATSPTL